MVLLYILLATYIAAVNLYAVLLMRARRDEDKSGEGPHRGEGKIILTALLGGAIAVYASMFAMRYGLKNITLMILMPVIAVLNVFLFYIAFRSGLTFFAVR